MVLEQVQTEQLIMVEQVDQVVVLDIHQERVEQVILHQQLLVRVIMEEIHLVQLADRAVVVVGLVV